MEKFIKFHDRDSLMCPCCSGINLHVSKITTYMRAEDEKTVTETSINVERVRVMKTEGKRNPSSRRDGMRIQFWCETCPDGSRYHDLRIYQHKGITYMDWERGAR